MNTLFKDAVSRLIKFYPSGSFASFLICHGDEKVFVEIRGKNCSIQVNPDPVFIKESSITTVLAGSPFYQSYTYSSLKPEKKELAGLDTFHLKGSFTQIEHRSVFMYPRANSSYLFHCHLTPKGNLLTNQFPSANIRPLIPFLYEAMLTNKSRDATAECFLTLANEILLINKATGQPVHLAKAPAETRLQLEKRICLLLKTDQIPGHSLTLETLLQEVYPLFKKSPFKPKVWKGKSRNRKKNISYLKGPYPVAVLTIITLVTAMLTGVHTWQVKSRYQELSRKIESGKSSMVAAKRIHYIETDYFRRKALQKAITHNKMNTPAKLSTLDQYLPAQSWLESYEDNGSEITLNILSNRLIPQKDFQQVFDQLKLKVLHFKNRPYKTGEDSGLYSVALRLGYRI